MPPSGTGETSPKSDYKVERFGPYEVHQRLGLGGMATVHLAMERGVAGFERWVALKRLLPHLGEDEEFIRSFVREAQLASRLSHPNVVKINQLGKVGDDYFISMEYIEGRDVRALLRQARKVAGPPPLTVIASLLLELLDALDYAHRKTDDQGRPLGLVHRDISPSNLLVNVNGHLKIIDFGIAKATSEQSRTQTGKIKGKLAYISPEVLRGKAPDARSDLFSVGIIAHELLTARPLFASKNDYKTIQRIQNAEVLPPSSLNTNCPAELDAWVLKALTKRRSQRWPSAREMLDALSTIIHNFHLHATSRDVASWVEWALSLPIPEKGRKKRGSAPRAPTIGEAEEELLEIIWGTHGGPRAPLNLDEFSARLSESRDTELETDPDAVAPTSLLFPVGRELDPSDESVDATWNALATVAVPDRVGVEMESDFESTEPNGLVGPGDSAAFGTIDLSAEDWLTDSPVVDASSALFSESELTALSEPLGGGPEAPTAPASPRPLAKGSLADVTPAKSDFDDTEPQQNAIGSVLLPPPVMKRPTSLFAREGISSESHPTTVRPVPMEVEEEPEPQPHLEAEPGPEPEPEPEPGPEPKAQPKKKTTLRGSSVPAPANPVDVVLLESKKTKKRITARTTVPPLPEPEEPTVTVSRKVLTAAPNRPTKLEQTAVALNVTIPPTGGLVGASPAMSPKKVPTTKAPPTSPPRPAGDSSLYPALTDDSSVLPLARDNSSPLPVLPRDRSTPIPALQRNNSTKAPALARDDSSPMPALVRDDSSPMPALARDDSSPIPLRPVYDRARDAAPTVAEPARTGLAVFLVLLAFLSIAGSVVAYAMFRSDPEPAKTSDESTAPAPSSAKATETPSEQPVPSPPEPSPPEPAPIPEAEPETPEPETPPIADTNTASPMQPTRLSGEAIKLEAPSPTSARVYICIDRRGGVQSVRALDKLPESARDAITKQIATWTYAPYRRAHKPVKACFEASVPLR